MQGPGGSELLGHYAMAHRLGLPVSAILDMPAAEFSGWCAYFTIGHSRGK